MQTKIEPTVELCLSLSRQLEKALSENRILQDKIAIYERIIQATHTPYPIQITNDNRTNI